jgi:DNA-binding NtrC family response regulator
MAKNILLVEDDRISREALTHLLRQLGHNVFAAYSAEEAKNALKAFSPSIALLDVRLPGLPGDAFAVYLKHKHPEIKIIFISGEFRLDDPERFGPEVQFLPKPLDFSQLLSSIN